MPDCQIHRPEFHHQTGDPDDLLSFERMLDAMVEGDVAHLSCRDYRLGGTLHLNKRIILAGANENPHHLLPRARILTIGQGIMGIRALRSCTFRDFELLGQYVATPDPNNAGAFLPSPFPDAHGIWCRRVPKMFNVHIERYAGDGVFLDSNTLQATSPSARSDAAGNVRIDFPAGHPFLVDMEISVDLPPPFGTSGEFITDATATWIEYRSTTVPPNTTFNPGLVRSVQNDDHWEIYSLRSRNNGRHGFHTRGPRSNAGTGVNIDCESNFSGVGIMEESFLGNSYLGCHASGNLQDYLKPVASGSNRSVFLGCYSEGSGITGTVNPNVSYPAWRFGGGGAWEGTGLAGSFDTSFGRPSAFINRNSANDWVRNASSVTGLDHPDPTIGRVAEAVLTQIPHRILPGMHVVTTGVTPNAEQRSRVVAVTNNSVTFQHPTAPLGPLATSNAQIIVRNHLELLAGGSSRALYGYSAEGNGAGFVYRKEFRVFQPGLSNWFITLYNGDASAVVEAESGELAMDSRLTETIGAGQKWFPNGFYFGGPAEMWKQTSERRGDTRVMLLREPTSSTPRAIGWRNGMPTSGDWVAGDLVWNAAPARNAPMGWICIRSAIPGPLEFASMPNLV
jgi:hypothetical protein